jgi:hypothetical protein
LAVPSPPVLHRPEDPFRTTDTLEFNRPDLAETNARFGYRPRRFAKRTSPGPAVDAIRAAMMTASPVVTVRVRSPGVDPDGREEVAWFTLSTKSSDPSTARRLVEMK